MSQKNEQKKLNAEESKRTVWRLAGLMKPFWALILLCCVLGVALNLADLVKPYIMKIAVDEFLTKYAGMGSEAANAAAAMHVIRIFFMSILLFECQSRWKTGRRSIATGLLSGLTSMMSAM